mmetsp:Transcript_99249/g.196643  ORF Transcript_99249/g.196643 Transcript_99249/m.196643 type:complete len:187 (-) Transcript_99249:228-788(-)
MLKHLPVWNVCTRTMAQWSQEAHPLAARPEQTAMQAVALMKMVPGVQGPAPSTTKWELAIPAHISTRLGVAATALTAASVTSVHLASSSAVRRQSAWLCNRWLLPPRTRSAASAAAAVTAAIAGRFFLLLQRSSFTCGSFHGQCRAMIASAPVFVYSHPILASTGAAAAVRMVVSSGRLLEATPQM